MSQNDESRSHENEQSQTFEHERDALRLCNEKDADEQPQEKRTLDEDEIHVNDRDIIQNDVRNGIADTLRRKVSGVEIRNDAQCQQDHTDTDVIQKAPVELRRKLGVWVGLGVYHGVGFCGWSRKSSQVSVNGFFRNVAQKKFIA